MRSIRIELTRTRLCASDVLDCGHVWRRVQVEWPSRVPGSAPTDVDIVTPKQASVTYRFEDESQASLFTDAVRRDSRCRHQQAGSISSVAGGDGEPRGFRLGSTLRM